jgi:hypothetical protein
MRNRLKETEAQYRNSMLQDPAKAKRDLEIISYDLKGVNCLIHVTRPLTIKFARPRLLNK